MRRMRGKFLGCFEAFRVECYNLPMHLLTSDDFYSRLHDAGWSVGDVSFKLGDRRLWLVYCHRGDEKIVAKNPSQRDAWWEAFKMACRLRVR